MFKDAAASDRWKGIVAVTEEQLVSSDIVGRSESSIVDLSLTQLIDGDFLKVFAWYDNEWGYSNRLVEQVINVGSIGSEATKVTEATEVTEDMNSQISGTDSGETHELKEYDVN